MKVIGSLQHLSLDVAAFILVLVSLWLFPELALKCSLTIGLFVPTLAVCAVFVLLCKVNLKVLPLMAFGALLGWALSPQIEVIRELQTPYDWYYDNFYSWAVYPPIGAALVGIVAWIGEIVTRKSSASNQNEERSGDKNSPER